MQPIEINQTDLFALVDEEDVVACRAINWHICEGYAHNKIHGFLHHFLIGKPPPGLVTDHKNRNKLDNGRDNLHFITVAQNAVNINAKLGIERNVFCMPTGSWYVQFQRQRKRIFIGGFKTKAEAIVARNDWFIKNEPQHLALIGL